MTNLKPLQALTIRLRKKYGLSSDDAKKVTHIIFKTPGIDEVEGIIRLMQWKQRRRLIQIEKENKKLNERKK